MKMFLEHLQTAPIPPSQRTELPIPRDLDRIVMACLEKDPSQRPQDAEELLQLLRRVRTAESWDNDMARAWWQTHLIEFTGPLNAGDPALPARDFVRKSPGEEPRELTAEIF
jgi:serine/threonine-protein kinase